MSKNKVLIILLSFVCLRLTYQNPHSIEARFNNIKNMLGYGSYAKENLVKNNDDYTEDEFEMSNNNSDPDDDDDTENNVEDNKNENENKNEDDDENEDDDNSQNKNKNKNENKNEDDDDENEDDDNSQNKNKNDSENEVEEDDDKEFLMESYSPNNKKKNIKKVIYDAVDDKKQETFKEDDMAPISKEEMNKLKRAKEPQILKPKLKGKEVLGNNDFVQATENISKDNNDIEGKDDLENMVSGILLNAKGISTEENFFAQHNAKLVKSETKFEKIDGEDKKVVMKQYIVEDGEDDKYRTIFLLRSAAFILGVALIIQIYHYTEREEPMNRKVLLTYNNLDKDFFYYLV
ncbi:hypothetical protein MHBO_000172 [Bonamia ostreae]|uniref:Uncharacterized protein n=1 Tax=Bonamia ostreae TaxID=126728 RepID=A0ABV2AEP0_9EUKA